MQIEPIGFATLIAGLCCLYYGSAFSVYALLIATLFGSSAAVILTSFNQANLQPAHLLLGFLALDLMRRPAGFADALGHSASGRWLLFTVVYGVLGALILPRLFAGLTDVFVMRAGDAGQNGMIAKIPLEPTTANITQSIYFIGGLVCFLIFAAYARSPKGIDRIANALILCAYFNIAFAFVDLGTYHTGTASYLAFMRNSTYRMLDDVEIEGMKRIVGSFSEASAFAYATLSLYAFVSTLWIDGFKPRLTGVAAALSLIALIMTLSSTGYLALAVLLPFQLATLLCTCLRGRATGSHAVMLAFIPLFVGIVVSTIQLYEPARVLIGNALNTLIFNKLSTGSGIERSLWNTQALVAVRDTFGWGVGIGSVRASSWIVAVLANIGIVGAITYFTFVALVVWPSRQVLPLRQRAIQRAAKMACFTMVVASTFSAAAIDLGLEFFALAALASARQPRARGRDTDMRPTLSRNDPYVLGGEPC